MAFLVPLLALAVPLLDTVSCRSCAAARAGQADLRRRIGLHMHHRLLDSEGSDRGAVVALYFLTACFCVIAVSFTRLEGLRGGGVLHRRGGADRCDSSRATSGCYSATIRGCGRSRGRPLPRASSSESSGDDMSVALITGHHGPGRLVPRRAPAREGLRGPRHRAPLEHGDLRAHRTPRAAHLTCTRPTCSIRLLAARACCSSTRAARGLQPRGAVLRAHLVAAAAR